MVLSEAENTSSTFADTAPTNDGDPYSTFESPYPRPQRAADLPSSLDLSSLPRPLPVIGSLRGYTAAHIQNEIRTDAAKVSRILQRPLHQSEWDAVAYHSAKFQAISSYAVPAGAALGLLRSEGTRSEFRFPFFKPEPKLGKAFFEELGPLKGKAALHAWHGLRGLSYASVGALVAKLVFGSYAASVSVSGRLKDPRLRELVDTIREIGKDATQARMAGNVSMQPVGEDGEQQPQQQRPPPTPTGRSAWDRRRAMGRGGSDAGTNTGTMSDQQMRQRRQNQQPGPYQSPAASRGSPFDMDKVARQPIGFDMDDASPTAGNEAYDTQSPTSSETSWDRIRRGNAPIAQPGQPRRPLQGAGGDAWARARGGATQVGNGFEGEQREGSNLSDSYSFSSADEDRQLAKSEAQKEFDQRVESERHGGDFDKQSSGNAWRR